MLKIRTLIASLIMMSLTSLYGQSPQRNAPAVPESSPASGKAIELNLDKNQVQLNYLNDIKYINRDGIDLHLQIIYQRSEKPLPCIVYIQGSAWMKQNVYSNLPQLINFARRGYIIVSVEYRPSDVAAFPAQILDARTAIRFVRKNAVRYNIDPENINVWGDSSGGHTAVLCGITSGLPEFSTDDYIEYSDTVNSIIDFYGPTDVSKMSQFPSIMDHVKPTSPEGKLLGGVDVLQNIDKAEKASPMTYITRERIIPPILIAHGSVDGLVPFNQSDILAIKLEETGKTFEFYNLKGADHGSPEFWTKEMFDIVNAFVRRHRK